MTDYELIIRFGSDTPFYEIRNYMINSLLNEFQNLYMWDLKRVQEGLIEKQKNRIAELEMTVGTLRTFSNEQATNIERLKKENTELKETVMKMNDVITKTFGNLTKAKELLAKWVELFKPKGGNIPLTPIQIATEQFLSEVE